ncbi:hypothetical protein GBZ48_22570 [Azospirillum melinis]|uniref:Uncharacterized protein n=1 Tax=Azospirillum melinis TaxID=328839 RepID=A0ABX2KHL8_9PROT|nr:hypothetical protein [Azospirillum melinis]MBP2310191.1 putative lysophospholipase L1 biosynthesis ABC-type transport system permease subunit [Azospirillum melinis]NUB02037.1 hypothetical protein [Azospirillum melinis]
MVLLLIISLTLSLVLLLGAAAMERAAILGRINGANGLTILVALVVSAAASLVVAVLAGWIGGWSALLAVLAGSALYHWGMAKLLLGGLQAIASRIAAADRAKSPSR